MNNDSGNENILIHKHASLGTNMHWNTGNYVTFDGESITSCTINPGQHFKARDSFNVKHWNLPNKVTYFTFLSIINIIPITSDSLLIMCCYSESYGVTVAAHCYCPWGWIHPFQHRNDLHTQRWQHNGILMNNKGIQFMLCSLHSCTVITTVACPIAHIS